jgi:O-antigen ligase
MPAAENAAPAAWLPVALLALVLFLAPLFPDVKLTRPKLLLLESGLAVTLFLSAGLALYAGKIRFRMSLLTAPLAIYGVVTLLFYAVSPDKPVALNELCRGLLSLAAFCIGANLMTTAPRRKAVLAAMLGGGFLAVVYGILQHSGGVGRIAVPRMDRVMSTFGNPIFFAAHILVLLPLALGLLFATPRCWVRGLLAVFILSGVYALYLTQTRAAYIALLLSLALFFWLTGRSLRRRLFLLFLLLAGFTVFALHTGKTWSRQQAHALIWRDALVMWAHHPWTGTGPGTFHLYFPGFASDELKRIWPQDQFIVNDAHNEYVQYLSETGVIGFGVFAWLVAAYYAGMFRRLRMLTGPQRYLVSGCVASVSALLAQNMFSVDMRFIVSAVYVFLVMGLSQAFAEEPPAARPLAPGVRLAGAGTLALAALVVLPALARPYLAQRRLAATPDFFDEKVLEPARTIEELERLAARYPAQAQVFEKLGWVYAKEKKWDQAIASYRKSHELDPTAAGPLNNLGNIHYLLGDRTAAIAYWTQSLRINPGQTDSRLNLAIAYYRHGQLKEAAEQLKAVLAVDQGNEKAIVLLKEMTE